MKRKALAQKLRRYFLSKREVAAVYLHGSRAEGLERPGSDVDVALLLNLSRIRDGLSRRIRYSADLERLLGSEVDVVLLNEADPLFRMRVYSQGMPVLIRDRRGEAAYRSKSMRDYWDFLPIMRIMDETVSRRLRRY